MQNEEQKAEQLAEAGMAQNTLLGDSADLYYCPYCEQNAGTVVKSGHTLHNGNDVDWAAMKCNRCGAEWTEV